MVKPNEERGFETTYCNSSHTRQAVDTFDKDLYITKTAEVDSSLVGLPDFKSGVGR